MSRASGASESSIDWFWQTMQRNPADSVRARASSTGSCITSSGWTASDGEDSAAKRTTRTRQSRRIGHSAACATALVLARAATPKRSLRSVSDTAPPSAITQPPSQISVTSGFQ